MRLLIISMRSPLLRAALLASFIFATEARAADATFESRPNKTRLLELFTSEGCSSCPPAEAWLGRLKDSPRLWQDFAPIAFHVDYWDRLGWRDPYAAKAWTERQYRYSAAWKNGSVYTPGFVLDGREWRNAAAPPVSSDAPGVLRISVANGDTATARFEPTGKAAAPPLEVHVAQLGFGLVTNVKAGENSGRKLQRLFRRAVAGEREHDSRRS